MPKHNFHKLKLLKYKYEMDVCQRFINSLMIEPVRGKAVFESILGTGIS